jgi:hypothetical protein
MASEKTLRRGSRRKSRFFSLVPPLNYDMLGMEEVGFGVTGWLGIKEVVLWLD